MSVTLFFSVIILLFLTKETGVPTTSQNNAKMAVSTQPLQWKKFKSKSFLVEIFIWYGKPQNSEHSENQHCNSELKRKKIGEYMHS